LTAVTFFMLLIPSACNPGQIQTPSALTEGVTATHTPAAGPILIQSDTAVPSSAIATIAPIIPTATETMDTTSSTLEITMEDNGKNLNMKVGDSFLLNLDSNFYDWFVEVNDQNVLSREPNVTVIKGAQGIYQARTPGSATLTASGNPKCINSKPPCLAPSVMFMITVIVQ